MKTFFFFFCTLLLIKTGAQEKVKFSYQNNNNTIHLFAQNNHYCPVTVTIIYNLVNMKLSDERVVYVIPARAENHPIVELSPMELSKKWSWAYNYTYHLGDNIRGEPNGIVCALPYQKEQTYKVVQGYNGKRSHENENALDFDMPEGTLVCVTKDGVVIDIVDKHNMACPTKDCLQYNNYVTVYHEDGSFSSYAHLKQNGAKVKIGQIIKQGDVIGLSGNTGWSTGPHLHFVVYYYKNSQRITVPTKFKLQNKIIDFLEEGKYYKKDQE